VEPLEYFTGNFDVVRENSEGVWWQLQTVAVVHYAIGDVLMWIIVLRSRIVRYFCFVVCL